MVVVSGSSQLVQELREHVGDERVLAAIAALPRERFLPPSQGQRAYENVALPIDCEQTISQPLVVARMLELLELQPTDRVLDVGTGSGYHAALLAMLTGRVYTIERHAQLGRRAQRTIASLGLGNVEFKIGDGRRGWPEFAPFDAINIAAAAGDSVPPAIEDQLAPSGRLVAPVGATDQRLTLVRRTPAGLERSRLEPVRFVPLVADE
jgi:protein-L-isoaspartate(D-aspartate) O-methyltransferase